MPGLTTLVEALICVICGSKTLVARDQLLYCGGCNRQVVRVPDDQPGIVGLARQAMRQISREEVA